ncbi:substrate-binding periplasmic protein [Azospirillum griseum]|nr:transporter substrate-binding domain-containing protein [Azospirillum griseum]
MVKATFLMVCGALVLMAQPGNLFAASVLKVAFEDKEQFPNHLGDGTAIDPAKPGISVEIVKAAAEAVGLQVEFTRMPWKRCLESLKAGQVDAVFNSSFQPERLEYGAYPGVDGKADPNLRITTIGFSLYRKKGDAVAWTGKEFTNLNGPIGAPTGYSIVADLKKMGIAVEEAPATDMNLKKLDMGRVSALVLQSVTADQILKTGGNTGIEKVEPPIVVKDYYVMLNHDFVKANPDQAQRFWAKVAELRDPMTNGLIGKYAQ